MLKKFLLILAAGFLCTTALSENMILDSGHDICTWKFVNGGEFPGAKGSIGINNKQILSLNYDFKKGGRYVGMKLRNSLPEGIKSITLGVYADSDCDAGCRVVDATGRVFQGPIVSLDKKRKNTIRVDLNEKWAKAWGGKESPTPQQPLKTVMLLVQKNDKKPLDGKVTLLSVNADFIKPPVSNFSGKNCSMDFAGWYIDTKWIKTATGTTMKISAVGKTAKNAILSITFPRDSRDEVKRFYLSGKTAKYKLYYNAPLRNGGNPRNIYKLDMELKTSDGSIAKRKILLTGRDSYGINFGKPASSMDIKSSAIGTCAHFSYGRHQVFRTWKQYRPLIDMISACGFKWVRDQCSVMKNEDGTYSVRPDNMEWIKYAVSKKLNVILMIFTAPENTELNLANFDAAIRDTKGLVKVFEISNEPNNFNYRPKYKGNWNGWEKDFTISKWVKVFVADTNAIADHVKKNHPDVTLIGLGAASPTNFHMLNMGITKNLDGVVDHPYTYSMPPEKIPFGHDLSFRDGIKIGDANHTYSGLVKSYFEHFKKTGKTRTLWETEFGFTTFWFKQGNQKGLSAGFTEEAQAVYLVRRFLEGMTLPIEASCQYDFIDDYQSSEFNGEANFGIVRTDMSPKPAYYAIQRMNSLFNGWEYDPKCEVIVEDDTLHRSAKRAELVRKWDAATIKADNGIKTFISANPYKKDRKMLTIWSKLPYSREFNSRGCKVRIKGLKDFSEKPVAIDIINGKSYDIDMKVDGEDLFFENLMLKGHPIVIKLFSKTK